METIGYVIEAGGCIIAYAIMANRTMKLASVVRQSVCNLSNTLLADDRLPLAIRDEIRRIVPHLAKQWIAWTIVLVTPVAIFSKPKKVPEPIMPDELLRSWRALQRLSIAAGLLNSPAATVIFVLMIGVASFFASFNGLLDMIVLRVVNWQSVTRGLWHPNIMGGT